MDHKEINQVFYDRMLTLTGSPEWDALVEEIKKEIYQHQANVLENANNWDSVVFTKGWCGALAYIMNLRSRIEAELEVVEQANADV
jgi:hypothetical protein